MAKEVIATIGTFDGVHRGHVRLIDQLHQEGNRRGLATAVVTFAPSPARIIAPEHAPLELLSPTSKRERLMTLGVNEVHILPFSHSLANMRAEEFARSILAEQLGVKTLLMGYDHGFGQEKVKDYGFYQRMGERIGMEILKASVLDDDGVPVSSSRIRKLLYEGNIQLANGLLGYPYYLDGSVIEGLQLGRTLGYPTANIHPSYEYQLLPADGVYAVWVQTEGQLYGAMLYIGGRPTLGSDRGRSIEVHIFDLSANLYTQRLRIHFVDYVRGEMKFASLTDLKAQLQKDEHYIRSLLAQRREGRS